jgi:hypothetical protein
MAKKIFKCSPATITNWVKKWSDRLELPEISGDIKEMEFDETRRFIGSKKTRNGYLKRLIVARGRPSHGLQATVILQRSKNFTTERNVSKSCKFYTDDWKGFSAILPKRRREIGKERTGLPYKGSLAIMIA